MAKKLKFVRDVYLDGAKVHSVGDQVETSAEMEKHVRRGNAVEIEVEEEKVEPKTTKKKK